MKAIVTATMTSLSGFLTFVGVVIISAYATHEIIILLGRRARDWMEVVAGIGGLVFLIGVFIAGSRTFDESYVIAYALQAFGVGLLILPRLVRITMRSLRN